MQTDNSRTPSVFPSPDFLSKVDQLVQQGAGGYRCRPLPIAIVKDGQIAYLQAYGNSASEPAYPGETEMAYCIGSVTKQFTATAVLLLVVSEGNCRLRIRSPSFCRISPAQMKSPSASSFRIHPGTRITGPRITRRR